MLKSSALFIAIAERFHLFGERRPDCCERNALLTIENSKCRSAARRAAGFQLNVDVEGDAVLLLHLQPFSDRPARPTAPLRLINPGRGQSPGTFTLNVASLGEVLAAVSFAAPEMRRLTCAPTLVANTSTGRYSAGHCGDQAVARLQPAITSTRLYAALPP